MSSPHLCQSIFIKFLQFFKFSSVETVGVYDGRPSFFMLQLFICSGLVKGYAKEVGIKHQVFSG